MGGTPRGKDKPRPSYEDGKLRDPSIEDLMDPTTGTDLRNLLARAVGVAAKTDGDNIDR